MMDDPRHVREKELQQAIYDCARYLGWLAYHVYDARRSTPGFPDLVLIRPPRLIVAELKTEKGKLSDAQVLWMAKFRALPDVETYVWRPSSWLSGEVLEILREGIAA